MTPLELPDMHNLPPYGTAPDGTPCMYIGEDHEVNSTLLHLCWLLQWHHDKIDLILLEYFKFGEGPDSPSIASVQKKLPEGFASYSRARIKGGAGSKTLAAEVAQLCVQCRRYNIAIDGWNIENQKPGAIGKILRASPAWNIKAAQSIIKNLPNENGKLAKGYIIFGGSKHGPLFKSNHPNFSNLKSYKYENSQLVSYDS